MFYDRGIAHCVKLDAFARIAELYNKYNQKTMLATTETETVSVTANPTETTPRKGKRGITKLTNWRPITACPEGSDFLSSVCIIGTTRAYYISCRAHLVDPQYLSCYTGECEEDEICVSAGSVRYNLFQNYVKSHCVKHEGFNRIAQLALKYKVKAENKGTENQETESRKTPSRKTKGKKQKRNLEKRAGWRSIDRCPDGFTGWTFITSVCDSSDAQKFWITCHAPYPNGRFGPSLISRPGTCSKTEICVSGYRGQVPKTPIPAYRIRNFGMAKCASQQSFVRIARMATENGGDKAAKRLAKRIRGPRSQSHRVVQAFVDSERTINASTTSQKVQQADPGQWIQKPSISRPLNVCPEPHRDWTVISSSCNRLGGSHQHFRMWCSSHPYARPGRHVRLKGRCSEDEVCVPGAGGVEAIPHPGGRRQGLTNARRAACVSVERISRIAKLVLDRKSKVDGRSLAPAGSGTADSGPEPAVKAADLAEKISDLTLENGSP